MKNELIPMIFKKPNTMFAETNRMIEWVSQEKDDTVQPLCNRIPEPNERKFPIIGFVAGGDAVSDNSFVYGETERQK